MELEAVEFIERHQDRPFFISVTLLTIRSSMASRSLLTNTARSTTLVKAARHVAFSVRKPAKRKAQEDYLLENDSVFASL